MDLLIFILVAVVLFVAVIVTINRRMKALTGKEDSGSLVMLHQSIQGMQQRLDETNKSLQEKLDRHSQTVQQSVTSQLGESMKVVRDVTEKLTKLDETNRQVINFSEQLRNLQDILQNPKQRGILGEYYLETVLKNVLPPKTYKMQYRFKNGEAVDAVIVVKDKLIPVDAKFSLENYNRLLATHDETARAELEKQFKTDLKNRIDETSKYIRPEEGTLEFAFMFIPSEAIYYDLLVNQIGAVKISTQDLLEYAFSKHVLIVSPTTFLAYLQTVLQGLRALQIEESAKEIRKQVEQLSKHLVNVDGYMERLGKNLDTTMNAYNIVYKELAKVDKDVVKIAGTERVVEPVELDKPENG